eukprot:g30404.t1
MHRLHQRCAAFVGDLEAVARRGQAFTWLFALRPIPSCAEHQGGGLRYGADVVCRERPIQRTEEDAGAYIAKASPDFVEALRALVALDFKLAVATNSDPAEYDLPGQSRESHILGPDLATALIKYWCREALPKFEVMVGFDPDLHDDPRLLGKSHHMRIIAEHYQVPFEEMLLIDDSARNLRNTDGWQGARERLLATLTDEPAADLEIKKPLAKPSADKNKNVHQSSLSGMGLKLVLPEGTQRQVLKGYERVDVPAAPPFDPEKGKELPQWAQVAFKGTEQLNTIQSIVFNAAFGRSQNLLICAPTGAGKTNIAVLTILRLIGQHMDAAGGLGRDFKVVYMAPMKALVGEVAEKFQQRLGPLGVNVAELTGDSGMGTTS